MAKHLQGWNVSSKTHNEHKFYVCSFSSAKLRIIQSHALKNTSQTIYYFMEEPMIWHPKTTQKEL